MTAAKSSHQIFSLFSFYFFLFTFAFSASAAEGQGKWEKTVEAARREGRVMAYASSNFDTTLREFQKRYPEIKVVTVLSPGRLLGQRILAERRAEKYLADLYIDGVDTAYVLFRAGLLDSIPPALLLPEVVDQSQWWQKKHHYADPESQYIFVFEGSAQAGGIGYNTRIVSPKEIRSYWDLLVPKWKGKIIAVDPESRGPAGQNMRFFYYSPKLGPVFIKRLFGEMDIVLTSDRRQLLDWLAVGKFAFGLFTTGIDDAKEQGLPVDEFYPEQFKEGGLVDPTLGAVSLLNRAPHPNAARVLMNWLLSREGQSAFQKQGANPNSMREDISKEEVAPRSRRVKGVDFLMTTRADWIDMAPIYKLIREARGK